MLAFSDCTASAAGGGQVAVSNDLRRIQANVARRRLNVPKSESSYRRGCIDYTYGCGYGTLPGYGARQHDGTGTRHR